MSSLPDGYSVEDLSEDDLAPEGGENDCTGETLELDSGVATYLGEDF